MKLIPLLLPTAAEDNPLNEYPDEESSQEDNGNKDPLDYYSDTDSQYEKIIDSDEEDEDWKWEYKLWNFEVF